MHFLFKWDSSLYHHIGILQLKIHDIGIYWYCGFCVILRWSTNYMSFILPSEPWHFWGLNVQLSDWTEVKCDLLLSPPTQHDTIRTFLTNKKPLFLSGKQNRCFIHYDPDYAQFKSKGNLDKNISSKELMIDFLYARKSLW